MSNLDNELAKRIAERMKQKEALFAQGGQQAISGDMNSQIAQMLQPQQEMGQDALSRRSLEEYNSAYRNGGDKPWFNSMDEASADFQMPQQNPAAASVARQMAPPPQQQNPFVQGQRDQMDVAEGQYMQGDQLPLNTQEEGQDQQLGLTPELLKQLAEMLKKKKQEWKW